MSPRWLKASFCFEPEFFEPPLKMFDRPQKILEESSENVKAINRTLQLSGDFGDRMLNLFDFPLLKTPTFSNFRI